MNDTGSSPQERAASWRREQQHWPWSGDWPRQDRATIIDTDDGLIVYGAYSWWPRGSVIEPHPEERVRSGGEKLIESPKISKDYVWQPLPWDDGRPDPEAKAKWMADLSVVKFCSECDGFVRSNEHEAACEVCGLVQAGASVVHGMGKKEIAERAREVFLDEMAEHANHDHIPKVKQSLSSAKIDQRVEAILLSQNLIEEITDSFGDWYKIRYLNFWLFIIKI